MLYKICCIHATVIICYIFVYSFIFTVECQIFVDTHSLTMATLFFPNPIRCFHKTNANDANLQALICIKLYHFTLLFSFLFFNDTTMTASLICIQLRIWRKDSTRTWTNIQQKYKIVFQYSFNINSIYSQLI